MFINIITPSVRIGNLIKIGDSINIPRANYRWIVVIDALKMDKGKHETDRGILNMYPPNAQIYFHGQQGSVFGNVQRNFALDLVEDDYVYFLDDDTLLHPDLWNSVKNLNNDFIHFNQQHKNGSKRIGGVVKLNHIDSGSVLIHHSLIGGTRWVLHRRAADGVFIEEVYGRAKSPIFINKNLSTYNKIR